MAFAGAQTNQQPVGYAKSVSLVAGTGTFDEWSLEVSEWFSESEASVVAGGEFTNEFTNEFT